MKSYYRVIIFLLQFIIQLCSLKAQKTGEISDWQTIRNPIRFITMKSYKLNFLIFFKVHVVKVKIASHTIETENQNFRKINLKITYYIFNKTYHVTHKVFSEIFHLVSNYFWLTRYRRIRSSRPPAINCSSLAPFLSLALYLNLPDQYQ